ncbi:MAG: carbohydrate ABC transporter permease [Actinobacteria bacterium]|nr:carbohydrate ABC transporter permease [Actinomycetota bacterium]
MKSTKKLLIKVADHLTLIVISSVVILPFLWMITTSLKPPKLAFSSPYLIPTHFYWQNFVNAWQEAPFARYYLNSIIVAISVTFGQVFTSALAAYAFDRFEFPFKRSLWFTLLASMMVPLPLLVIPSFQIIQNLHWADNLAALIIPRAWSAFGILLLRQFIHSIPRDFDDAARMDGASTVRVIWSVILPLARPAVATLALFAFLFAWNDFLWPLIVLNTPENFTVPLGIANFSGKYGTRWTLLMAATVSATIPAVIAFLAMQKSLIRGLASGGINE